MRVHTPPTGGGFAQMNLSAKNARERGSVAGALVQRVCRQRMEGVRSHGWPGAPLAASPSARPRVLTCPLSHHPTLEKSLFPLKRPVFNSMPSSKQAHSSESPLAPLPGCPARPRRRRWRPLWGRTRRRRCGRAAPG